jgi:hypothetical protein
MTTIAAAAKTKQVFQLDESLLSYQFACCSVSSTIPVAYDTWFLKKFWWIWVDTLDTDDDDDGWQQLTSRGILHPQEYVLIIVTICICTDEQISFINPIKSIACSRQLLAKSPSQIPPPLETHYPRLYP